MKIIGLVSTFSYSQEGNANDVVIVRNNIIVDRSKNVLESVVLRLAGHFDKMLIILKVKVLKVVQTN